MTIKAAQRRERIRPGITAHKTTFADDDGSFDRQFWRSIPADDRFVETWR